MKQKRFLLVCKPESGIYQILGLNDKKDLRPLMMHYKVHNNKQLIEKLMQDGLFVEEFTNPKAMMETLKRIREAGKLNEARQWAKENGHHDGDFLFRLVHGV